MLIYSKYTLCCKFSKRLFKGGFTFGELLVVMALVTTILTVVVFQQNSWGDRLSVTTQSYELALMIRQAQIYSLGVREYALGTGDKFDIGYGIYIDEDGTRYIFFVDKNRNQKYDIGEALETKTFAKGAIVSKFCGYNNGGVEKCSPDVGNISSLHISFFRPEAKANIALLNNGGNSSSSVNPPTRIYLRSVGGKESSVKVETNGQISIIQ